MRRITNYPQLQNSTLFLNTNSVRFLFFLFSIYKLFYFCFTWWSLDIFLVCCLDILQFTNNLPSKWLWFHTKVIPFHIACCYVIKIKVWKGSKIQPHSYHTRPNFKPTTITQLTDMVSILFWFDQNVHHL